MAAVDRVVAAHVGDIVAILALDLAGTRLVVALVDCPYSLSSRNSSGGVAGTARIGV